MIHDIGAIKPTGLNKHFNHRFYTVDDLLDRLKVTLKKYNCLVYSTLTNVQEDGGKYFLYFVNYFIDIDSGNHISFPWIADAKDAHDQWGIEKAITTGYRKWVCKTFMISDRSEIDDGYDIPNTEQAYVDMLESCETAAQLQGAVAQIRTRTEDATPELKQRLSGVYNRVAARLKGGGTKTDQIRERLLGR